MNIIYLHPLGYDDRPRGHEPDHHQAIADTLTRRGHTILPESRFNDGDLLLFSSDVWNLNTGGTSPYNKHVLAHVLKHHIPVVWFDNFDHSGDANSQGRWPGSDDWQDMHEYIRIGNHDWAYFGWAMSRPGGCRHLYLMRKMQVHQDYPENVFPLEYPVLEDFHLVSKEELCRRPVDVCGLANIALARALATIG